MRLQGIQSIGGTDSFYPPAYRAWGFDPELLFLADKFKLQTAEVPVEWAHDHRSKISPLRDGIKMGLEVLKVRWNAIRGLYQHPAIVLDEAYVKPPAPQVAE